MRARTLIMPPTLGSRLQRDRLAGEYFVERDGISEAEPDARSQEILSDSNATSKPIQSGVPKWK
jgi:hypothetical protein